MGKPNSFIFCRMHDMKGVLLQHEGGALTMLSAFMPQQLEHFALIHPEFSQSDALLAMSGLIALDDAEQRKKYARQMEAFSNDLGEALNATINTGTEMIDIVNSDPPSERSGIYAAAFCCGMYGKNDAEMRNAACSLLDRVLQMEEEGVNVREDLTAWMGLACLVDFESWHDETYGSPIMGKSPLSNVDADGNPIQRQNNGQITQNSGGGGCYVATAVYGSYDCPEVWTLRRYRDFTLAKSWYGRLFIRIYYAISPKMVALFGETSWFKGMWRIKLDRFVKRLQEEGVASTYYEDKLW